MKKPSIRSTLGSQAAFGSDSAKRKAEVLFATPFAVASGCFLSSDEFVLATHSVVDPTSDKSGTVTLMVRLSPRFEKHSADGDSSDANFDTDAMEFSLEWLRTSLASKDTRSALVALEQLGRCGEEACKSELQGIAANPDCDERIRKGVLDALRDLEVARHDAGIFDEQDRLLLSVIPSVPEQHSTQERLAASSENESARFRTRAAGRQGGLEPFPIKREAYLKGGTAVFTEIPVDSLCTLAWENWSWAQFGLTSVHFQRDYEHAAGFDAASADAPVDESRDLKPCVIPLLQGEIRLTFEITPNEVLVKCVSASAASKAGIVEAFGLSRDGVPFSAGSVSLKEIARPDAQPVFLGEIAIPRENLANPVNLTFKFHEAKGA